MRMVLLTALGIGGSTIVGAIIGLFIKKITTKVNDIILGFAAGVMLAAAVTGLILPAVETGGKFGVLIAVAGIFCGALFLNVLDRFVPHLHRVAGCDIESHCQKNEDLNKILLFVLAIAMHNLPEGMAAGVSFGSGDMGSVLTVAGGIALQNIPEGIVVMTPMVASGVKRGRAFLIAAATGLVEVVGTIIGYFTVSITSAILPFLLAFAGGTMIYVISDEMIPETHANGNERAATYALLAGFCVILIMNQYIGG